MSDCQFVTRCGFFTDALGEMPEIVREGYKSQFCHTDNAHCARYVVATTCGREHVPVDMGPHESTKAVKILQSQGHHRPTQLFL
jgi:hypothetical protein